MLRITSTVMQLERPTTRVEAAWPLALRARSHTLQGGPFLGAGVQGPRKQPPDLTGAPAGTSSSISARMAAPSRPIEHVHPLAVDFATSVQALKGGKERNLGAKTLALNKTATFTALPTSVRATTGSCT